MGLILLPQARTRQPQATAGLKPRKDIAAAWAYGANFGSGNTQLRDLVRGGVAPAADTNNTFAPAVTRNGVAGKNTRLSSPSALSYTLTSSSLSGLTRMSLMVWFEFDGTDDSAQWLNFRSDGQHSLDIFSQTSTSLTWGSDWLGAWNGASQQTLSGLKTGDLVCLIASIDASGARLFHNGIFSGTKSGSGFTTSSSSFFVANGTRAKMLGGAAFSSALSDGEAIALSKNPWQLFAPLERKIWVSSGAVNANATGSLSAITLSAATAAATGSSTASASLPGLTLAPATAAATGGASAAGTPAGITLSAPQATAIGSAVAAASLAGLGLTAATASATTTADGYATAALSGIKLMPATASAVGSAAAVAAFAALSINPATGAAYGSAVAIGSLRVIALAAATGSALSGDAIEPGTLTARISIRPALTAPQIQSRAALTGSTHIRPSP